jgi:hypothetical protein
MGVLAVLLLLDEDDGAIRLFVGHGSACGLDQTGGSAATASSTS